MIVVTQEGEDAKDLAKRLEEAGFFDALVIAGEQLKTAFANIGEAFLDAFTKVYETKIKPSFPEVTPEGGLRIAHLEDVRFFQNTEPAYYPRAASSRAWGMAFPRAFYDFLDEMRELSRQIRKNVLSYVGSLDLTTVSAREWAKRDARPPVRIWEPGFQFRGKHTARFGVRGYSHARAWKRRRHS